jgi:uncharacterized protein YsxB (DUF464 family)
VLEVTFYRDDRDRPAGLRAHGHADFDEHGKDVVCAAVSAILQAARLGLTEYANVKVVAQQEPGVLELRWAENERDDERLRAIVVTAQLATEQIADRYPEHVRVKRVTPKANRRRTNDV